MENEKKDIDVFQDESPKEEKEIFIDYTNQEPKKDPKMVSKKTAIISIIATFLVLIVIGGSFAAGFFTARQTGIEGDMPMLQSAYETIKKYYYKDISWSDFQELVTAQMVNLVDDYTYLSSANSAAGGVILGFTLMSNKYNEHFVAGIVKDSPCDLAIAKTRCSNPTYSASGSYRSVEFATQENVESEQIKIDVGDILYAVSFNGIKPIIIDGLSNSERTTLLNKNDRLTLYFIKSDGNGGYDDEYLYKYIVEKKYVKTTTAFLYTPEEIGDTTGKTAMIALSSFSATTIKDFASCTQAFVEGGYTNLILDLRFNGGGAGEVLDFIGGCLIKGADKESKKILYFVQNSGYGKYVGKYEESTLSTIITNEDGESETIQAINLPSKIEGFKMTVLCNGYTASSSEALIGALMFYNDTKIIGTKTYGKGVGQITIPFANGKYYLTLTNGYYYIPTDENGDGIAEFTKTIHGEGFTPEDDNLIDEILRPIDFDKAISRALTFFEG